MPHSGHSNCSSASSTPVPSRAGSPLPQFLISNPSYSSSSYSESESEQEFAPSLGRNRRSSWRGDRTRWWPLPPSGGRRRDFSLFRKIKRFFRRIVRHPFVPKTPLTIILSFMIFTFFAISLTLLLMYILNPDKEPLPWRAYCSMPYYNSPPDPQNPLLYTDPYHNYSMGATMPSFPHEHLETLPPVGLFIGVFSTDSSFERRALIRSTWASHARSRNGAGTGDNGNGTSRTVVRFVLGQPRGDWARRIQLEMEEYNDIVILPMSENMNGGKSHTYFSWASINAWVPPVYTESSQPVPQFSYSNASTKPPPLAPHDPPLARKDTESDRPKAWVRPDYVVKADEDAFIMLAELEARLRLALHDKPSTKSKNDPLSVSFYAHDNSSRHDMPFGMSLGRSLMHGTDVSASQDPLIYWGYLVTNRLHRFMAGELYALSWSLADWVARDPSVKDMTKGAEDKQTAKWMKAHPQAYAVRWVSERCWIYDHPRAGTVYTHGFLFPSEVTQVRESMAKELEQKPAEDIETLQIGNAFGPTPSKWAHSSVSTFHARYSPPADDLNTKESIEAMVEGSDMSLLRDSSVNGITKQGAWVNRQGRKRRYENQRVGGTVVVHFIKQNMWFLETALALLEGEEETEAERFQSMQRLSQHSSSPSLGALKHRRR
ncbi:hypothetical protein K435DRAFT_742169 [Dendrothele bispora CBS 962.96]|uniref:Glycosyltransferase family 31 protein n=1 Tax=Dendrothele bispora (strain CBS 962.96) TaxID=1314807 RepID=A0A4S8MWN3_DENBC|nr:hypothetical protein K435DRAFT_742169 [Dendrothele bispora CBS 962.96]